MKKLVERMILLKVYRTVTGMDKEQSVTNIGK